MSSGSLSSTSTTTTALEQPSSRPVRRKRRASSFRPRRAVCHTLPQSLEALDLPSSGARRPTLASLRLHVLAYLADLETRLSLLDFDSPLAELDSYLGSAAEGLKSRGECKMAGARDWAHNALERIACIRDDVLSHLPEVSFTLDDLPDVFPDASSIDKVRSRLPDMPDLDDVRSRLPDMPDFEFDMSNLPPRLEALSGHLHSLQAHLADASSHLPTGIPALEFMSLAPSTVLSDFLDKVITSDRLYKMLPSDRGSEEGLIERAAKEFAHAIERSMNGLQLIAYSDLPHKWRNNPHVATGYRFIPLERWPLIALSLLQFHNETLNIHTHLLPFVFWLLPLLPISLPFLSTTPADLDTPELLFVSFALLCLFSSSIWHTMAGCSHAAGMEFCARVDYVGIGWLISASVGTVVYYAFSDHTQARDIYLGLSFVTGVAGSILPFMDWFNQRQYKKYRIVFFLALAFTAVAPLAHFAVVFSPWRMLVYVTPIMPSIASYLIGLVFYASHFPENLLGAHPRWRWLDHLGGGSHAIWHAFIVLAISQHRAALADLRLGVQ